MLNHVYVILTVRQGPKTDSEQIRTLEVGTLNTGGELYDQIRALTGQIRRAMMRGRDLQLQENPKKPLADFGCGDEHLIQIYTINSPQQMSGGPSIYSCDVIEDEIMKHSAEFHTLLDLPEPLAANVRTFLLDEYGD